MNLLLIIMVGSFSLLMMDTYTSSLEMVEWQEIRLGNSEMHRTSRLR